MTRPLVSVVTPCYNTEAYLAECIESVLRQSHDNFEYIIVDNACTDRSGEIAREYAACDSRIRVVRNEQLLPQVENVNRGLSLVSTESSYVKVVLADDWLYPDCLKLMVELAERHPRVGLVSSYYVEGRNIKGAGLPPDRPVVSGREASRLQLIDSRFMFGSPSTVLFRAEIIRARQPFYETGRLHEDTEACFEVLRDWDFGFVHQVLSFLRVDPQSLSGTVRDFNPHLLDKLIVLHRFGRTFLTEDEYESGMRQVLRLYHGYLGQSLLARRPPAFWDYHRRGLATIGLQLDRARLTRAAATAALRLVLNPFDTAAQLISRLRHRQS